jgi:hypothetical protein
MPLLLSDVESMSRGQLRSATPQALAGLAVGLAHWDHRPDDGWIKGFCLEAFVAMDGFGPQVEGGSVAGGWEGVLKRGHSAIRTHAMLLLLLLPLLRLVSFLRSGRPQDCPTCCSRLLCGAHLSALPMS